MNWGLRALSIGLLLAFTLAGCDRDDAFSGGTPPGDGDDPDAVQPIAIDNIILLAEPPVLPSNATNEADGVTITAVARNANNVVVSDVPLTFTADSGALTVLDNVTNPSGRVNATLTTGGDPRNRTITVQASSGETQASITVAVTGTKMTVAGPQAIESGVTETFTVRLLDAGDVGLRDLTIEASSEQGNLVEPASAATNTNGRVTFEVTGTQGGQDVLTFSGADLEVTRTVQVSTFGIEFTTPATGTEVNLGDTVSVGMILRQDGNPASGQSVAFTTTRGTLSAQNVTTGGDGSAATVLTASGGAGPVLITASGPEGVSRKHAFELVATVPSTISVQAEPSTVAPGGEADVIAVVRDAASNPVKNQVVSFTLNDVSGGGLTASTDVTDSQGIAQTSYVASGAASARDGVTITARVDNPPTPVPADTATLTVAAPTLFLALGTDNQINKNDATATYEKVFNALITDAAGNPAPPTTVFRLSLRSYEYQKGRMVRGADIWVPQYNVEAGPNPDHFGTSGAYFGHPAFGCTSEDPQGTGNINLADDYNNNGQIDPVNVALVPSTVEIDADGVAAFTIRWPQNYAFWVLVRLTATATVSGTETTRRLDFVLPIAAEDVALANSPPNIVSPFGVSTLCIEAS